METAVTVEPTLNPGMLVGGAVVADDMDLLFSRHSLIDQAQKLQPLVMTMSILAQTVDFAGGGVEGSKQRGRALRL